MTENQVPGDAPATEQEEKSQARQDYEAGLNFMENNDLAQAANSFHNALLGFDQENNESGVANAADRMGDICAKRGDFDRARQHYERAYAICDKFSDRLSLFSIEKKLARLMYEAGEYEQAINRYLDILAEYSALRNPQGSVDTLETLAEIYLCKGDRKKAADSYRMAASIHQKFKHRNYAARFMEKAAEIENS